jgi:hypothetical protein
MVHLMRDENAQFASQEALDTSLKDVLAHLSVNGAQGVIQEVHIGIHVDGARKTYARLLPARQGHTTLSNLCLVAVRQPGEILTQ